MENTFGKLILMPPNQPEQEFELGKANLTLGRAMTNDIIISDVRVSRWHARLDHSLTGFTIQDLGSSNGVFLNGALIQQAELNPGDVVQIGDTTLRFELDQITPEPGATVLETEADLEHALDRDFLPMTIKETGIPRLVVFTPEKTWELSLEDLDRLTIGRTDENEVMLPESKVSRQHAEVVRARDGFLLRDLGSTNGVIYGDRRVEELQLKDGDRFRIGSAQIVYKAAFTEAALTMASEVLVGQVERRPVVFVPGLMGSQLWQGSEQLWPNVKVLLRHPELFAFAESGPGHIEARGIVDQVVIVPNFIKLDQYNRLGDYLVEDLGYQRGLNFFEFAYDWRMDVRLSARKLAEFIEALNLDQPITLIAHSLGTLVSRYYLTRLGGEQKVERVMLMGGPHHGVPKALMSLLVGPNVLPFGLMGERLRQVSLSFPTSYQILPTYPLQVDASGRKINFLEDETWLAEPLRPMLRSARAFRHELGTRLNIPTISIFGYGLKTVNDLTINWEAGGRPRSVNFRQEPLGDSTIPERSAVLEGSEIHPVQQYHGALFVDNDVKMRLKLELTRNWR